MLERSRAREILTTPDRTDKERRDMAEFMCTSFEWPYGSDLITYSFNDRSALLLTVDSDLQPVEFLVID